MFVGSSLQDIAQCQNLHDLTTWQKLVKKKKQNIQCPDIPAANRPVPHGGTLPVPEASQDFTLDPDVEQSVSSKSSGRLPMR